MQKIHAPYHSFLNLCTIWLIFEIMHYMIHIRTAVTNDTKESVAWNLCAGGTIF